MSHSKPTAAGAAATDLILEVFRLNGLLLAAGDALVAELGLTSARWQVMGAIALGNGSQPVAWLARSMGLHRQGVQRIVNELKAEGLVELKPNPHHRRAKLVALTGAGQRSLDRATERQVPWVNTLAQGLTEQDILQALIVVRRLRKGLEASE